ncbi:MAG: hypothetical protein IKI10_00260 [Muribaculaceae bacterium]|nr:hypothetical protein [Muribaculaceae bacterium]
MMSFRALGASKQVELLHKASGLDLSKHHGERAAGPCGVVARTLLMMGPEWGH